MSGFGVVRRVESCEEGVKRTAVEPFERKQHAHADIELTRLVFGIGRAADVAAAALQSSFFFRVASATAQSKSALVTKSGIRITLIQLKVDLSE